MPWPAASGTTYSWSRSSPSRVSTATIRPSSSATQVCASGSSTSANQVATSAAVWIAGGSCEPSACRERHHTAAASSVSDGSNGLISRSSITPPPRSAAEFGPVGDDPALAGWRLQLDVPDHHDLLAEGNIAADLEPVGADQRRRPGREPGVEV